MKHPRPERLATEGPRPASPARHRLSRHDAQFVVILIAMLIAILLMHFVSYGATGEELPLPPPPVLDDPDLLVVSADAEASLIPVDGPPAAEPEPAAVPSIDLAALHEMDTAFADYTAAQPEAPPAEGTWGEPLTTQEVRAMLADVDRTAPSRLTLESMLMEQLRASLPGGGSDYIIERATLPDALDLPHEGWSVKYSFRLPANGLGATPFSGVVSDGAGTVLRRFSGSVWLDREARGIQPTRMIRRGEVLGKADVQAVDARLSALPRGALTRLELVENTVARQELRPGQWLTDAMLDVPDAVKRNHPVTIRLERGPLQITTHGVAREAGALGEVIRVENLQSRRVIFARVLSSDEVQVIY